MSFLKNYLVGKSLSRFVSDPFLISGFWFLVRRSLSMGPDLLLVLAEFGGDLEDDDDEALFEFADFCFELLGPGLPPEGSLAWKKTTKSRLG
jgi:hypothetical protein